MTNFFQRKISKDQSRDTGMAMVLLFLLIFVGRKREGYLIVAILLHLINMVVPQIYRPVAVVWLGISDLMGSVASKIMLSVVFFAVVTPVGILRRMFGRDALKLRAFKASQDSVMLQRNHTFIAGDLEKPY